MGYEIFYSETCLTRPLKKTKIGFQYQLSLNAGQKYCRMLPLKHSAILLTFIKLPFVIKTFVLPIFEWPLKTGFTVFKSSQQSVTTHTVKPVKNGYYQKDQKLDFKTNYRLMQVKSIA